MDITVAICTWNRAKLLDQTLAGMQALRIPDGIGWELLVVNNNCTDETDAVLARHTGRLPLRKLLEERQGLSHARNCAVDAAQGKCLLWTDDDVLVNPDWLCEYVKAANTYTEADIFGGPIDPWFESPPSEWLRQCWPQVAMSYAVLDRGDQVFPLTDQTLPFGANYAVRTDVQRTHKYDTTLGRKKHGLIGSEELDAMTRILADGHRGFWLPQARVRHYIPADRMTISYLRRFYQGRGQTDVISGRRGAQFATWRSRLRLLRRAVQAEWRYRRTGQQDSIEQWLDALKTSSRLWGTLRAVLSPSVSRMLAERNRP